MFAVYATYFWYKCSVTIATKHVIQELNWKQQQIINYQQSNGSNIQQLNSSIEAIATSRLATSLDIFFRNIWCNPDVMELRSLLRWWQAITVLSHHSLNFTWSPKKEGSICSVTVAYEARHAGIELKTTTNNKSST